MKNSTICAISTSPGVGGIAVIRISGPDAIKISDTIFQAKSGKTLLDAPSHKAVFGDVGTADAPIDEVLATKFNGPNSFTGEDTVEISCHGSVYIQQEILKCLLDNGASMATPGEFTQRAFLNGKMDLSQAEAVADLIASTSKASHKLAMNQMRGGFSNKIKELRDQLLHFITLVELELDFSEEDVEFADRNELQKLINTIVDVVTKLSNSFQVGNALKNGVPVTIVGETNVGKSTLLNALLEDERAIVSDIHGTTRDVIEDTMNIDGTIFRFIDTAGIRNTVDKIEAMGIERTFKKVDAANIVLILLDLTRPLQDSLESLENIRKRIEGQNVIIIGNKADEAQQDAIREMVMEVSLNDNEELVFISAKAEQNIGQLRTLLLEASNSSEADNYDVVVTNLRHYEALNKALTALNRVTDGMQMGISGDLFSQDIREALHHLGDIVGEIPTDDVLGNIFKNFCIGK